MDQVEPSGVSMTSMPEAHEDVADPVRQGEVLGVASSDAQSQETLDEIGGIDTAATARTGHPRQSCDGVDGFRTAVLGQRDERVDVAHFQPLALTSASTSGSKDWSSSKGVTDPLSKVRDVAVAAPVHAALAHDGQGLLLEVE